MLTHIALACALAATSLSVASPTPAHEALDTRAGPGDINMFPALARGRENVPYVSILLDLRVPNGTPVRLHTARSGVSIYWTPPPAGGEGHLRMAGSGMCVDAGLNPTNGQRINLWQCLDVPQQQWRIRDGRKIELVGYNLCFDVRDGDLDFTTGYGLQLWQCADGNPNQDFVIAQLF